MSTTGWGRATWGSGAWGTGVFETVSLTGVPATGTIGSIAAAFSATLTGVSATVTLGTLSITGLANIDLTSVFATGALGTFVTPVYFTGVSTQGVLGGVLVWDPVPDGPSGNWIPVDTSQP